MAEERIFELGSDCRAKLLPDMLDVILAKSTRLRAAGVFGGKYEVRGLFGAALLDATVAEKIGLVDSAKKLCGAALSADLAAKTLAAESSAELTKDDLWNVAKTVYDPEIPVNIVDLGLVYSIDILNENGVNKVLVDMTLTAPGCAMGPAIANDLKMKLESLPSVCEAFVNIVWDPPWNQDMMSEDARMILGLA